MAQLLEKLKFSYLAAYPLFLFSNALALWDAKGGHGTRNTALLFSGLFGVAVLWAGLRNLAAGKLRLHKWVIKGYPWLMLGVIASFYYSKATVYSRIEQSELQQWVMGLGNALAWLCSLMPWLSTLGESVGPNVLPFEQK